MISNPEFARFGRAESEIEMDMAAIESATDLFKNSWFL